MKPVFLLVAAVLLAAAFLPTSPAKSSPPRERIEQSAAVEPVICECPRGGDCDCDPCECPRPESQEPEPVEESPYGARGKPLDTLIYRGHRYGVGVDGRLYWMHEAMADTQPRASQPASTTRKVVNGRVIECVEGQGCRVVGTVPESAELHGAAITYGGSCANGSCGIPQRTVERRGIFGRVFGRR